MKNFTASKTSGWAYWGEWPDQVISSSFWCFWRNDATLPKLVEYSSAFLGVDGRSNVFEYHFFYQKKDFGTMKAVARRALEARDDALFALFGKIVDEIVKKNVENSRKLADAEKAGVEVDEARLAAFFKDYAELIACRALCSPFGYAADEFIEASGKAREMISALKPASEPLAAGQQREFKKIVGALEKEGLLEKINPADSEKAIEELRLRDSELAVAIERHVSEYAWSGLHNFEGEPYDLKKFFEDTRAAAGCPLREENKFGGSHSAQTSFSEKEEFVLQAAGETAFHRQRLAEFGAIAAFNAFPYLEKTAESLGLTRPALFRLTWQEILSAVRGDAAFSESGLKARSRFGIVHGEAGERVIVGSELEEFEETFLPEIVAAGGKTIELKGKTACPGKARGTAKIIRVPADFERFKAGDVLVTTETTPYFVPLMRKAAAIVTDMGGVTSHAAIVSRELGVPCVVGTRFATRALRDGDLVEVDSSLGVVRKIS